VKAHAANVAVAERLREAALLLQSQGAAAYHTRPYRDAAQAIESEGRDVRSVLRDGGVKALDAIPNVGLGIASAIAEMLVQGRWLLLDRLRGESDPVALLKSVPGIGDHLAQSIHHKLHVETLVQLERAANDGTLAAIPGMGPRTAAAIRAAVGAMLARPPEDAQSTPRGEPDIGTLLGVDSEYRGRAARGELPLIAPKRLNPDRAAWLPIMHVSRGPWNFTALFSNTARAHELGRTHDWVVVYFYDLDHVERTCTVVTEHHGPLAGRRVVRGREEECVRLLLGRGRSAIHFSAHAHAL
jgi:hypothetical protein